MDYVIYTYKKMKVFEFFDFTFFEKFENNTIQQQQPSSTTTTTITFTASGVCAAVLGGYGRGSDEGCVCQSSRYAHRSSCWSSCGCSCGSSCGCASRGRSPEKAGSSQSSSTTAVSLLSYHDDSTTVRVYIRKNTKKINTKYELCNLYILQNRI